MDNSLSLLGIAKKAGKLQIGDESVASAARNKKARVILTAQDASPGSKRHADSYASIGNTLHVRLPYKKYDLGGVIGRGSPGILAITDIGIASSFVTKLAAIYPDEYGDASDILGKKSTKMLLRRREALAHARNIRTGKRRTK